MSEELLSEDDPTMKMEEDGEGSAEDTAACGDGGPGEAEGSKIDASKNEEDEG